MYGTNYRNLNDYLDSNNLYREVSPDEIFWRYLSYKPDNTPQLCIFHKERTPSLLFKNGRYKCFGCGKSGDAVQFVKDLFNCDYKTAIFKICEDFKLGKINTNVIKSDKFIKKDIPIKNDIVFSHEKRKFNIVDKNYWSEYEITKEDLIFYNIFPVTHVNINNNLLWIELDDNPIYHLECWGKTGMKKRYYRPFNTEEFGRNKYYKWRGDTKYNSIFGYVQLLILLKENNLKKDILFITSSLKDVVTLYKSGYYSIAPSAEVNFIDIEILTYLKTIFKHIYVFFNNDEAGKLNSLKYTELYNLKYINLPDKYLNLKIKDPSDMVKKINRITLNEIIEEKLKRDGVE